MRQRPAHPRGKSRAPKSKAPPPPAPRRRRSACPERSILDDEITGTVVVRWTIDGSAVDLGDGGWAPMDDARTEDFIDRIQAAIGDYFADLAERGERLKLFDGITVEPELESIVVTDGPVEGALAEIRDGLDIEDEGEGLDRYWWQRLL